MIDGGEPDTWPLGPAERIDLIATDPALRGPGERRAVLSAITFFAPRAYVTDSHDKTAGPSALPHETRRIELHYGIELDFLLSGTTYRTADVTITLPEDCLVVAVLGLPGSEHDIGGSRFRQRLDRPEGGQAIRTELIVEIPDDRTDVTVSMNCEVHLSRSVGARWHGVPGVAAKEVSFTSAIPAQHAGSAVRLFVATDLAGFGQRGPLGSGRAQRGTADAVDRATGATGIKLDDRQEHGDSLQLTFRPAIDERAVLRAFYLELLSALREHNRDLTPEAALRLRVGIDRGLSDRNSLGWDRAAPIVAARLRDCTQARAALKDEPKAPLVLVVSDVLYRDIFSDLDHEPSGTAFTEIAIADPDKGFSATAWLHIADE